MFQAFPCLLLQTYICMNKIWSGSPAFKPRIRLCATTCFYNHAAFRFAPVVSRSATLMPVSSFCLSFNFCRVWRCAKEYNSLLCALPVMGGGAVGCHESFAVAWKHHFSQHTYVQEDEAWSQKLQPERWRQASPRTYVASRTYSSGGMPQSSRMEGSTMIN